MKMNQSAYRPSTLILRCTVAWFVAAALNVSLQAETPTNVNKPNIIYILADDLGYSELGCYGQQKIKTPRLDQLASEGMRFTQHYSGNAVCAPSRCVLLTGKHAGHAFIRNNKEIGGWGPDEPEGQWPIPASEVTIAELLKAQGYATCAVGKWGLGGPGSTGHPCYQGFDHFYGYLCQRVAHNYYPTHLWRNHDVDVLGNRYFSAHQKLAQPPTDPQDYAAFRGEVYAPDKMLAESLKFIRQNKDQPFFFYYASPVPHVALQVPEDSLEPYKTAFDDTPYLGEKGYLPHPTPRAAYAAMISRMDRDLGEIFDLLKELQLDDNTLIIFSSDNGPTFNGGTDSAYFDSAGPLRGLKVDLFEGGIRVPMIARWPGKIPAGSVSDHVSGFQDLLPTLAELLGFDPPTDIDGVSMLPTLLGQSEKQPQHELLYWELGRQQAARKADWKLYRRQTNAGLETMLFDLKNDIGEQHNLAEERPEILKMMVAAAAQARTPSQDFPSPIYGETQQK
jgi:arylsulfatase A-like enzyme